MTPEGGLAFPNATIHISAADWTVMQGHAPAAALVQTITPKVQTFAPGAVVAPGVSTRLLGLTLSTTTVVW